MNCSGRPGNGHPVPGQVWYGQDGRLRVGHPPAAGACRRTGKKGVQHFWSRKIIKQCCGSVSLYRYTYVSTTPSESVDVYTFHGKKDTK